MVYLKLQTSKRASPYLHSFPLLFLFFFFSSFFLLLPFFSSFLVFPWKKANFSPLTRGSYYACGAHSQTLHHTLSLLSSFSPSFPPSFPSPFFLSFPLPLPPLSFGMVAGVLGLGLGLQGCRGPLRLGHSQPRLQGHSQHTQFF